MMDRLAPGSYLAVSHVVSDEAKVRQQMTEVSLARPGAENLSLGSDLRPFGRKDPRVR